MCDTEISWSEVFDKQFKRREEEDKALADKILTSWPELEENLKTWSAEDLFTYYEQVPVTHLMMAKELCETWNKVREATKAEIIRRMSRGEG